MPFNAFAPPQSAHVDVDAGANDIRKPLSVWLLQLLVLPIGWLDMQGMADLFRVVHANGATQVPRVVAWLGLDVMVLLALALTVLGSEFRHPLARWLGVLVVAVLSGAMTYFSLVVDPGTREPLPPGVFDPNMVMDRVMAVVVLLLGALLCWRFAFTARARRWFGPAVRA